MQKHQVWSPYRCPQSDVRHYLDTLDSILEQHNTLLLFGDTNIDLLIPNRTTTDYINMIESTNLEILNKIDNSMPTRPDTGIIDHVKPKEGKNSAKPHRR